MADDRTLYAGDLSTDHLGKRIRVTVESGATVEDILAMVHYDLDPGAQTSGSAPRVWVQFTNIRPNNPMSFDQVFGSGFFVGHTAHVVVLSH